jgi:hypothetical protein
MMLDMLRDAAEYHEASESDPAESIDKLEDHVRELVAEVCPAGTPPKVLRKIFRVVLSVVQKLLNEGRLGPSVVVSRLEGKDLMARLIAEIIDDTEPLLMARCIDFTFGLGVQCGASQTKIATLTGFNKASVSRRCVYLSANYLGGRPAVGMKSPAAVSKYRALRTGCSSRAPRVEWALASTFHESYGS